MKPGAVCLLSLLAGVSACAPGEDGAGTASRAASRTADLALSASASSVTLTSTDQWRLSKTGAVDGTSVNWTITAVRAATTSGRLVLEARLTLTNTGSEAAAIGNLVVNLQTRQNGTWKSVSADVADATSGDGATSANIQPSASSERKSSFDEDAASESLVLKDATNNAALSLVPELSVLPGQTRSLLLQATFDNHSLQLASGTAIRYEVIVSFGNAPANRNSARAVDIDGSGTVDADEQYVRSVPSRLTQRVPLVESDAMPTLSDTMEDIVTTGTVTFGNALFSIGAVSGMVTVTVDGGASGGTIANCAHLTSPDLPSAQGIDLTACDTQTIAASPPSCTPGAPGCPWTAASLVTYGQVAWDMDPTAQAILVDNYSIYAPSGLVEIGIPGTAGFSARFSSAGAIFTFLPAAGASGSPLTADLNNPTSTIAGLFAGDVLALLLDVDYSAANALGGTSSTKFGDLILCDMTPASLNNLTVSDYLALVNRLLGGDTTTGLTISDGVSTDVGVTTALLANAFGGGTVTSFAVDHLRIGSCVAEEQ